MTDQEILAIAHRTATVYRHRINPKSPSYEFVNHTMIDFARKVEQAATYAALERAAQVCDAAEIFAWEQWKGTGHPHTEGVSDGAASLAWDIRALKEDK